MQLGRENAPEEGKCTWGGKVHQGGGGAVHLRRESATREGKCT